MALLALVAVAMTATTPGEGANIGAGAAILSAMLAGLVATVLTVLQQRTAPCLGRRALTAIAAGALATAVLAAAVGQGNLAAASLIPAVVCAAYAVRGRTP